MFSALQPPPPSPFLFFPFSRLRERERRECSPGSTDDFPDSAPVGPQPCWGRWRFAIGRCWCPAFWSTRRARSWTANDSPRFHIKASSEGFSSGSSWWCWRCCARYRRQMQCRPFCSVEGLEELRTACRLSPASGPNFRTSSAASRSCEMRREPWKNLLRWWDWHGARQPSANGRTSSWLHARWFSRTDCPSRHEDLCT